jgi:hypothetical protein
LFPPDLNHFLKADLQGTEKSAGFGVDADAVRPARELLQGGDFFLQLLPVDGREFFRLLLFLVFGQDFIEQVILNLFAFDQFLGELRVARGLLVPQVFQPLLEGVEGGGDGFGGGCQQLSQDQGGQVPLPLRQGLAVFALQEGRHRLVEGVFVVGGAEWPGEGSSLGVADIFSDLVPQGAFAEG